MKSEQKSSLYRKGQSRSTLEAEGCTWVWIVKRATYSISSSAPLSSFRKEKIITEKVATSIQASEQLLVEKKSNPLEKQKELRKEVEDGT